MSPAPSAPRAIGLAAAVIVASAVAALRAGGAEPARGEGGQSPVSEPASGPATDVPAPPGRDRSAPAQPTVGTPTAAPPVATCVSTPPRGLYPDLVVWPPWFTLDWPGCSAPAPAGPLLLRVEVDNLGDAPALGFWIRAAGCTAVPVQERVEELLPGSRVTVDFLPVGAGDAPCVILADAECELRERARDDDYWTGQVALPTAPPPCVPTARATPSATPSATQPPATATSPPPARRYVPWARR